MEFMSRKQEIVIYRNCLNYNGEFIGLTLRLFLLFF